MYTANIDVLAKDYTNRLPTTYDFLRPNAFKFAIKDIPGVSYTCQSATTEKNSNVTLPYVSFVSIDKYILFYYLYSLIFYIWVIILVLIELLL